MAIATRSRTLPLAALLIVVAVALAVAAGGPAPKPRVFRVPGGPSALVSSGGRVWIATPRTGAIVVLDAATGQPSVPPLQTGGTPARLALGTTGLWAADAAAGTIIPVQTRPPRVFPRVSVGPDASDVALAGGALYVASSADGRVYVRSPAGNSVLATGRGPIALASDGRRVLVADSRDGTLAIIDAGRVVRTVRVGGALVDVALAGDVAWVADAADGDAIAIDLRSGRVLRDVAVGRRPVAVAIAGADTYVLSERGLLRIRDGSVKSTRAAGSAPTALAVDDHYVWVASGDSVLRFDR